MSPLFSRARMLAIKVKLLHPDAILPSYQSVGASGFDFHSVEDLILPAGAWRLVSTGLAFEIPSGMELQVRSRSGLALKHGIAVLNSPGTVDSDYRGDVGVILINHSKKDFEIKKGDRIAQGVLAQVIQASLIQSQSLSQTQRGEGGFGSSGVGVGIQGN